MIKTFTWTRPDQPYYTTTELNRTIEVTYNGPRYWLIEYDPVDGICRCANGGSSLDDPALDHSAFAANEWEYVVVDANDEAITPIVAYLTDMYTHPDPTDHTETFEDADGNEYTYSHTYDETTGLLTHDCWATSVTYNAETKQFNGPLFRTHVNSKEETFRLWKEQAAELRRKCDTNEEDWTDAEIAEVREWADHLEDIPRRFADIDHWKIPDVVFNNEPSCI